MFCIGLGHDPATETCAQSYGHLRTPLEQCLAFDHVSELRRLDAKLIDGIFQFLELLINYVHDVLLALCGVCHVLVVMVTGKVIAIGEAAGLDVARHSQYTVLLQVLQCFLRTTFHLPLDTVEEVDLELWPSCLDVKLIYLLA